MEIKVDGDKIVVTTNKLDEKLNKNTLLETAFILEEEGVNQNCIDLLKKLANELGDSSAVPSTLTKKKFKELFFKCYDYICIGLLVDHKNIFPLYIQYWTDHIYLRFTWEERYNSLQTDIVIQWNRKAKNKPKKLRDEIEKCAKEEMINLVPEVTMSEIENPDIQNYNQEIKDFCKTEVAKYDVDYSSVFNLYDDIICYISPMEKGASMTEAKKVFHTAWENYQKNH